MSTLGRFPRRSLRITRPSALLYEVEIIGFDDGELAEPLGLTTVRQPLEESGEVAAELLLAMIEDPQRSPRSVTLELSLVERNTTTASAHDRPELLPNQLVAP